MDFLIFVVSLAVLIKGSDWFVASAERIGLSLGISPFIVGVTIVAFGTSLPELATSIASVLQGAPEVVMGNVVGSNITNILLVLGLAVFVGKGIKMPFDVMHTDMPMLLGTSLLLFFMLRDGQISIPEAIVLLCALAIFLMSSISGSDTNEEEKVKMDPKVFLLFVFGGVMVYFGAVYTIESLSSIAARFNISPAIISLGAIALGTSLPEVIVSLNAARRGNHAIAVGNVLGSNVFNSCAVVGLSRFFGPLEMNADLEFNLLLMLGVTILFLVMCLTKHITRWEGGFLLLLYAYFVIELGARLSL